MVADEVIKTPHLIETVLALSEIPLQNRDRASAFQRIAELARDALGSCQCTLILADLEKRIATTVACAGCDPEYASRIMHHELHLGATTDGHWLEWERFVRGETVELYDLQNEGQGVANPKVAQRYGFDSLLSWPLVSDGHLIGYFNHFARLGERQFAPAEKTLIEVLARQASVSIALINSLTKVTSHDQLNRLNRVVRDLTRERKIDSLLEHMLDAGLDLVGCQRGWISRLNHDTGYLVIVAARGDPPDTSKIKIGEGITGWALQNFRPVRVDNIHRSELRTHYKEFWSDTLSELAVPILMENAEVRIGKQVQRVSKPLGVFNAESPIAGAFTNVAQDLLVSLAGHAALLIDQLDREQKLARLRDLQQEMAGVRDWDSIVDIMSEAITRTLGFSYVNLSLVDKERRRIKTEHIVGVQPSRIAEFKKLANHSLDSDDIQAAVVHSREIEVPDVSDPRFDEEIYHGFNHRELIRVYIPMIAPSSGEVMGTVETGYSRQHRPYIYEQDIQVLKGFVDYTARALEQKDRGQLDKIYHELLAPTVGIRNNASVLQRRFTELTSDKINRKCEDILLDCETLINQVEELGFILGRPSRPTQIEQTRIFRDVIVKTVHQLKQTVVDYGFNPDRIIYDAADLHKIPPLYLDKTLMNRVLYNLLINAIKYARDDPGQFTIRLSVESRRDGYVISIKDWGIGILPQDAERVFEEGFRTKEAKAKDVRGTGLGLTIARKIVRELGGELVLAQYRRPTEFQILLPRELMEEHHAAHDR